MKTAIVLTVENTENLKIVKHHIFSIKHQLFLLFASSVTVSMK